MSHSHSHYVPWPTLDQESVAWWISHKTSGHRVTIVLMYREKPGEQPLSRGLPRAPSQRVRISFRTEKHSMSVLLSFSCYNDDSFSLPLPGSLTQYFAFPLIRVCAPFYRGMFSMNRSAPPIILPCTNTTTDPCPGLQSQVSTTIQDPRHARFLRVGLPPLQQ